MSHDGSAAAWRASTDDWWRPGAADGERPAATTVRTSGGTLPFGALLVFTCILILAPQSFIPALAPLRPALLAAMLGIGAHVAGRLLRAKPVTIVTREIVLAACLLGWALVTLPFSRWPGGSAAFIGGHFLKSLAIFWLIANCAVTPQRLRALTLCLVLLSVPLGCTAVRNFATGAVAPGGDYRDVKRIVGYEAALTANPNDLALMLNLILPFAVAHLIRARTPRARAAFLAVAALDAVGVVLTFSRAGFLTLGTILLVYLATCLRGRQRGIALATVLVVALCLPLLPPAYLQHMQTIMNPESDTSGSAQQRWSDMVAAAWLVLERPLVGAGAGMNLLALNDLRGPTWKSVHNVYLAFAVDLGLPGLILFTLLLVACLTCARRAERRFAGVAGLDDLVPLALAARVSLIAFALAAVFHPAGYHFYFYYIAGLAVALGTLGGQFPRPERSCA